MQLMNLESQPDPRFNEVEIATEELLKR